MASGQQLAGKAGEPWLYTPQPIPLGIRDESIAPPPPPPPGVPGNHKTCLQLSQTVNGANFRGRFYHT